MSSAPAPPAPGVTFEVERFEWAADDRLEVVGRWFGLRGHRFLRPTLDVEVRGERRRMLAVLDHKPWAADEGEEWIAAFDWTGDRAKLDDAELTVSPDLAVQLPLPDVDDDTAAKESTAETAERRTARRPRTAVLEDELAAAMAEVNRLTEQLAREREVHSDSGRELRERARVAQEATKKLESELEQATGRLATSEAQADSRLEEARRERDRAVADRDMALKENAAALAERDAAAKVLAAAESERDAMAEARDRARDERNAWMSRARAATAEGRGGATAARVPSTTPASPPSQRIAPPPQPHEPPTDPHEPPTEPHAAATTPLPPPTAVHAAATEPLPPPTERAPTPPPSERRTIRIGERPGPLTPAPLADSAWPTRGTGTPRLIALVALGVVALIVLLLLLLAF